MRGSLKILQMDEPLMARLAKRPEAAPHLFWLGQAGFVIEANGRRLVIDPYLSDSLATKYRGRLYPHERMMSAPISSDALGAVDLVLSTHQHTDHMDPDTLRPLLAGRPDLKLVAPRAAKDEARRRADVGDDRLLLLDAGETIEPLPGIRITATRAAHETLEQDDSGHYRFLGYVIELGDWRVWHSGDTIPFAELAEEVGALQPDVALLPVNGRSPTLLANGVPGNLALAEAIDLGRRIGVASVIAHHFGMFDFNTLDPAIIDAAAAQLSRPQLIRADPARFYVWDSSQ